MRRAIIFNPKTTAPVRRVSALGPMLKKGLKDKSKVKLIRGLLVGQVSMAHALGFKDRSETLIIYIGHGHENNWVGEYRIVNALDPLRLIPNELCTSWFNDHLLSGAICVAIACDTGVQLAHSAVAKGCRAYIGSRGDLYVGRDQPEFPYGTRIRETYASIVFALRDGATVRQAVEVYRRECQRLVEEMASKKLPLGQFYTELVLKNANSMQFWGDGDARWG